MTSKQQESGWHYDIKLAKIPGGCKKDRAGRVLFCMEFARRNAKKFIRKVLLYFQKVAFVVKKLQTKIQKCDLFVLKILKGRVKSLTRKKVKRINEQTLAKLTKLIQFNFGVKTSAGNIIEQYLQQQNSNTLNTIRSDLNACGNILSVVRETCR